MAIFKYHGTYIHHLFTKLSWSVLLVLGIAIAYVTSMSFLDHQSLPFSHIVLILAVFKTGVITYITLTKVSKLTKYCHSINHLLWTFGLLILIALVSFASDYTCLFQADSESFRGVSNHSESYLENLYQFIYFSMVTFTSVGYGDIAPVSDASKFVVMLEIILSFIIIVFSLTMIKNVEFK